MAFKEEEKITTISFSELGTWLSCPQKWYLQYYGPGKDRKDKSEYLAYGTQIHKAIQSLYQFEENIIINDYKKEIVDELKNHDVIDDARVTNYKMVGTEIIKEFNKSIYKNLQLNAIEYPIHLKVSEPEIFFKGFIDLVLHDNNGNYKLIDLKTAKSGWNKYKQKDALKHLQLLLYKYFFSIISGVEFDKIACEFVVLNSTTRKIEPFTIDSSQDRCMKAYELLHTVLHAMYVEKKLYKNSKDCLFCPFSDTEHCDKVSPLKDYVDLKAMMIPIQ